MLELELSRKALKAFIEEGIKFATEERVYGLTRRDTEKLRAVSDTLEHVAFGQWTYSNAVSCGCPAVEAGLYDPDRASTGRMEVSAFANRFDNCVVDHLIDKGVLGIQTERAEGVIYVKD
jgi:hypothetical protein